jgi:hypothetical protein
MSRLILSVLIALLLLPVTTTPAATQKLPRAAVGAGLGVVGGSVITISAIVWRARFQGEYLESADDLINWQSVPMIAAPAAGMLFGVAGKNALVGSIIGSTTGLLAGAALGAGIGWLAATTPESPWAGGVIGAGIGLSLGGLLGGFRGWREDADSDPVVPNELRVGFTIPLR